MRRRNLAGTGLRLRTCHPESTSSRAPDGALNYAFAHTAGATRSTCTVARMNMQGQFLNPQTTRQKPETSSMSTTKTQKRKQRARKKQRDRSRWASTHESRHPVKGPPGTKRYVVVLEMSHESFGGYDHKDGTCTINVEARSPKEAGDKAVTKARQGGGGYAYEVISTSLL